VKLIKADNNKLSFYVDSFEKRLLLLVLGLYPLVPAGHQPLSRNEKNPEAEKILEEAVSEQRQENKERINFFVLSNLQPYEGGYRLILQPAQVEWLLQVLNDIQIGSWLLLGCPVGDTRTVKDLTPATAQYLWAREMAGEFQWDLLHALDGGDKIESESSAMV
jgi:hypothetical protein